MESMLLNLPINGISSSTTDDPSTSNTNAGDGNAGDENTREAIRAAWEELLIKGLDETFSGVPDSAESSAPDDSEDAFQKKLREATERLRRSDTELQVLTG
jgi:hypothetical protein